MIAPIFERTVVALVNSDPSVFTKQSLGRKEDIHAHFGEACGTKVILTFERWPDRLGRMVETLHTPPSIPVTDEASKQIFGSEARPNTVIFENIPTYLRHATDNRGTPPRPPSAAKAGACRHIPRTGRRCCERVKFASVPVRRIWQWHNSSTHFTTANKGSLGRLPHDRRSQFWLGCGR